MKLKRFSILSLGVLIAVLIAGIARSTVPSQAAAGAAGSRGAGPINVGVPLAPFNATGLPAGPATGLPLHVKFPTGFTLKHIHGGPTYVYVISGSFTIRDAHGTKTYGPGSFLWEPGGHVHTFHVIKETELFILVFLAPGGEAIVPVK